MCVDAREVDRAEADRSITGAISAIIDVVSAFALQRLWWPSRTVVSTSPILVMPDARGRARRRTGPAAAFSTQTSAIAPRTPAAHRVHQLHHLEMQTCVVLLDRAPDLDERRLRRATARGRRCRPSARSTSTSPSRARRARRSPVSAGGSPPRRKRTMKRGVSSSNSSKPDSSTRRRISLTSSGRQVGAVAHRFGCARSQVRRGDRRERALGARRRLARLRPDGLGPRLQQEDLAELRSIAHSMSWARP